MKSIYFLGLCLLVSTACWGQRISLEEAISKAIAQNPSIKIQRLETSIAQNNVFKGNTGALPVINLIGGASYLNNLTDIKLRTFQSDPEFIEIEEAGVENINANIGVQADYIVYDGQKSRHRLALLQGLSDIEKAEQEVLVNEVVLNVTQLYLEMLKLQNQAAFLRENIANSEVRIEKVKDRKQFGKANRLDILQLQTALNRDEAVLDDVLLAQNTLSKDLNFFMGEPLDQSVELVPVPLSLDLPDEANMLAEIQANNPQLQLARYGILVADQQLKLSETDRLPTVGAFANVGYLYQQNDVQQLARIHNAGVTLGISASYNLFDGGVRRNRIQNARISVDVEKSRQELLGESLLNQALKERQRLDLLQSQLAREERNLATFEEAYTKTQDLFLAGKVNNLALRDAQLARLDVLLRIDQIKIDQSKSYLILQQLMGKLVE